MRKREEEATRAGKDRRGYKRKRIGSL